MTFSQNRPIVSLGIIRLVGYGLLTMALIDFLILVIPPQLMNPDWEMQTIGAIVERTPVTLLGMALVFYDERSDRTPIETLLLKWLSWMSLMLAIFFFLTIPLNISNSFRIYYRHNAAINQQVVQQTDVIDSFTKQLQAANSNDKLLAVLQKQSNRKLTLPDSVNLLNLKDNLLKKLQTNQSELRTNAQKIRSQKRNSLFKNCLKWNLGGLISAILFLFIWQKTLWTRLEQEQE